MVDVEIDTNVKDFTNRINFGIIVCTSGTRPTAVDGKPIYETDTDKFLIYDGAAWEEISGGGVTDHGALTGLTDDDHTQYLLVAGTRAMTGNLLMGTNKITGLAAGSGSGDALRYEQLIGAYLLLAGGTMSGNIVMGDNDITGANVIQATASQNLTLKVSTGSSIVFQAI